MQTAHHDPQPPRVSWRHARRAIEIAVGATLGGLIGMTWYGRVNVAGLVTLAVAASIGAGVGLRRAARRRRLPDERDLAIDRLSYMVAAYAMFVTAGVGLLVDRLAGRPGTAFLWVAGLGILAHGTTTIVARRLT